MAENTQNPQPASLTETLAMIDRTVEPVTPAERDLSTALGYTLAADAGPDNAKRLTGSRLRRVDIALFTALKIERVAVRKPRVLVTRAAKSGPTVDAICTLIAGTIESEGGIAIIDAKPLDAAVNYPDSDAVIAIGRDDPSLRTLTSMGKVECDGLALIPGGDITFGFAGMKPVLLLPGRIESALTAWLTLGRRLLARLAFRLIEEQPYLLELARPITSKHGLSEIIPVRRRAAQVEPLAGGDWTSQTIARADGWILVPAESEGHPAGTMVQVRAWP